MRTIKFTFSKFIGCNLPNSITHLTFGEKFNHSLNNLPDVLEYLYLSINYNQKISNIPKGLKKIKCFKNYKYINDF